MSSPAQRRSQRNSASATPRRGGRNARSSQIPSSSPAPAGPDEQLQSEASQASQRGSQATPRNQRLTSTQTQSPLFFRSSPINGSASGAANGAGADADSEGDRTPRASGMTFGGTLYLLIVLILGIDALQTLLPSTMPPAPALAELGTRRTPQVPAATMVCLFEDLRTQRLVTGAAISSLMLPVPALQTGAVDSSWTRMAWLSMKKPRMPRRFRT
jgi:hypothetical protein